VSEVSGFCIFLDNDKTDLCQFFSGFKRKHLLITTRIKKHYRPLRFGGVATQLAKRRYSKECQAYSQRSSSSLCTWKDT